jgi:hypothetical protein
METENELKSDSQELKLSFKKSVTIFEKVLDGEKVMPDQLSVAMATTKLYTNAKAIENQRALLVYQVARDYSKDKNELRDILKNSIQNVKFLPEKSEEKL